jgi:hypothetical protein
VQFWQSCLQEVHQSIALWRPMARLHLLEHQNNGAQGNVEALLIKLQKGKLIVQASILINMN